MSDEKQKFRPKITYLDKKSIACPVCGYEFQKEILQTGRGRLNAGQVTETLHRMYLPSEKFGKIYPLVYSITTCPDCLYSTLPGDFLALPENKKEELNSLSGERIRFAEQIIGEPVDYNKYLELPEGTASYALAVLCYDYFDKKSLPVIKQAICSIRTAFLFEDLEAEKPNRYYRYVSELFYKKALFFYPKALELNQNREQIMENLKVYGPDIDKNYGYDGIMYLIGILKYKYGIKDKQEVRIQDLHDGKSFLGKLFGLGKSDYDKPKEILDKSKEYYDLMSKELKKIDEQKQG